MNGSVSVHYSCDYPILHRSLKLAHRAVITVWDFTGRIPYQKKFWWNIKKPWNYFRRKNCQNFELVLNILSAENFVRRIFMMRYFSNVCKYLSPTEPPGVRFPSRHRPHPSVLVHGSREGGPGQTGSWIVMLEVSVRTERKNFVFVSDHWSPGILKMRFLLINRIEENLIHKSSQIS